MKYRKPKYYDEFSCAAGNCPETCCAGWQISIDEDSLIKYHHMKGDFARRLQNSIDWMWDCFYQDNGRCAMLNDKNLCDIQSHAGEEFLCETCREFPRHIEEFETVRELSLSLACPLIARKIINGDSILPLIEWETDEEDVFDEFDSALFIQLESNRRDIFHLLQNHSLPIDERLNTLANQYSDTQWIQNRYTQRKEELNVLNQLPLQRNDWCEMLEMAEEMLYNNSQETYDSLCCTFEALFEKEWEKTAEALCIYFIYTYYLGAVYDDMPSSKVKFSLFSISWIKELALAKWIKNKDTFCWRDVERIAWCYSRQMEHDDDNLLALEEFL